MNRTEITKLNSIKINFRGLKDTTINFGERITLICGKNGTSKSTILGVVAQTFSFSTDYTTSPHTDLSVYSTLRGERFKSLPSDHFRLSKQFDTSGSMNADIEIYDAAERKDLRLSMKLYDYKDRSKPRPIIRGNTTTNEANSSRNVTHPVIFLSLKRLMPICLRQKYSIENIEYLSKIEKEFKDLNNKILNKENASKVTATKGTIDSIVVHSSNYDHDSVSIGEDNTGQILQAIFSFKKLKEDYKQYKGGILLIDEADAGLFPAAQIEFIKILAKTAKDLNLQIIMTSHSPIMIEQIKHLSTKSPNDFKTIYLTDTFGKLEVRSNLSWPEIYADLHVETIKYTSETRLPKVNVYFEDNEACDLFTSIVTKQKIKRPLNLMKGVKLGSNTYTSLIQHKIPEFCKNSIIILDGDTDQKLKIKNIVKLPGEIPPDQLIFELLLKLPGDDPFWDNHKQFTRPVFLKIASPIISRLNIDTSDLTSISLKELVMADSSSKERDTDPVRVLFKRFYNSPDIQSLVKGNAKENPFRKWADENFIEAEKFIDRLVGSVRFVLINGHGMDSAVVSTYPN